VTEPLFEPLRLGARSMPAPAVRLELCRDCHDRPRLPAWRTCEECWRARRSLILSDPTNEKEPYMTSIDPQNIVDHLTAAGDVDAAALVSKAVEALSAAPPVVAAEPVAPETWSIAELKAMSAEEMATVQAQQPEKLAASMTAARR
jgi:hypothetical protein